MPTSRTSAGSSTFGLRAAPIMAEAVSWGYAASIAAAALFFNVSLPFGVAALLVALFLAMRGVTRRIKADSRAALAARRSERVAALQRW